jgi:hypothetical protein
MSWGGQVRCWHFGSLDVDSFMFNVVYLESGMHGTLKIEEHRWRS